MLISFEVREGGTSEELDVFVDEEGLASLMRQLQFLQDKRTDHVHLMPESWGGSHLAEEAVDSDAKPLRHVKITHL